MKQNLLIFIDFTKKLFKNRYMLKMMALRELRMTYVGSAFGFLWAVMNPLTQVVIYGVVFGLFFKSTPPPQYGTDSYFLYLVCGLVPWQFFSQAVSASPTILITNSTLVKKAVAFPSEVLPIVNVASNLISQFISLALLFIIIIIFTGTTTPYALSVFVYLFFTAVLCVGLSWILSSMNVFLRDIPHVLGLLMTSVFFLTPIVYSSDLVPAQMLFIMKLNPVYHLVEGYRLALLAGRLLPAADLAYFALSSFVIFGVGGVIFRKLKPWFAEVL